MKRWERSDLLVALNLYFRTPFGQQHKTHQPIIRLAEKIGRSPSSVAMKLSNFTSLDPAEQKRGIKGLSGASQADRMIWAEFSDNLEQLAEESELVLETLFPEEQEDEKTEIIDQTAVVKIRRHQRFFRRIIISSYKECCSISGLSVPQLLIASHIKPWAVDPKNRLNPSNGICLAATYDAAFDRGLIGIDDDFCLIISAKIRRHFSNPEVESVFGRFEGKELRLPEKNLPNPELIRWHRENLFRS